MKPLVSIAIPVFNAESTIEIAVKSVLMQTYSNWELFLINDGSTDQSLETMMKFKDPRISILNDNTNRGLISRLNSIPAICNGKYLARMDADDIMHPDRLSLQVDFMENNPQLDIIDCAVYIIDEENTVRGIRNMSKLPEEKRNLLEHCLFTHPAVLGKRKWFLRHQYSQEYYRAEDYELWLRAYEESNYGRINQPLLFYREGNVNIQNYVNSMKSVRKIMVNYGPGLISIKRIRRLLLTSYLKQYLYIFFGFFKFQRVLASFRSSAITITEGNNPQNIIVNIIDYKIN